MKKLLLAVSLFGTLILNTANADTVPVTTVGIIIPLQLGAMTEIVEGFQGELNHLHPGKIVYLVKNANGDPMLAKSILQSFINQKVNLVVPVGTSLTQMALSTIKNQPIAALAAEIQESDRPTIRYKNFTNILDEVDLGTQLTFVHQALPQLKNITIIYSPDDHVIKQLQNIQTIAKENNFTIKTLMISQLPDLYAVSKHLAPGTQAIFILKDAMIVSGINTLIKQTQQNNLLLIASDDGSVQDGAAFALGVSERQIGSEGAVLANTVLNGTSAANVPIKVMTDYRLFINEKTLDNFVKTHPGFSVEGLSTLASQKNYLIIKY
jgi:putative ABC transport system substrate-binding protein